MGAARQWDDIEFVASLPAAIGTADERMQRTERDLIDAALAVNDAPTLEEALSALAEAAISLTGADRISVIEWDPDYGAMTVIAGANTALRVGTRIEVEGGPAFARGEPFVVGETHLACLPAEMAELVRRLGTVLSVPVVVEGVPPVSFQAIWESPQNEHVCDVAAAKLRLLARLTDIAFRAERERDRARQERQLRAVLEAVPHGLVVRTDRGAIVNSAARDLLATHEPPETIVLHELDGSPVDAEDTPLHRAKRTGDPQSYKMWVTRADGVQRLHEGTIGPVTDADGRVFATVTAFRDVTQEHEERFATEQFLESLFGALPTSVGVATADTGEVVSVNRAFLDLIGYELDEVLGNVHPYPWWADGMGHIPVEPGVTSTVERLFRRKDGTLVPVETTRCAVPDSSGAPATVVSVMTDLSERRAFEQQLIQSGKLASIGELAAGVAHEVNNPLFAILGLVEFLLMDAENGTKAHERLTLIQSTALEIKEIVRALLDFARERSDERGVISLMDVVSQTVELMRRTSAAKQIDLVERYAPVEVPVHGSANQLKQIFVNLISNANQAMKGGGGTITVEVGRDGDVGWAEVRDTGPGIPPEILDKIFEPFFTTRRDVGGTGLGLSVSFGIAQAHDGSLTVESVPGEGTAFRLRLPITASEELAA
jgi:PAS domain S-box-containing protein